jgi:hypothetical protein
VLRRGTRLRGLRLRFPRCLELWLVSQGESPKAVGGFMVKDVGLEDFLFTSSLAFHLPCLSFPVLVSCSHIDGPLVLPMPVSTGGDVCSSHSLRSVCYSAFIIKGRGHETDPTWSSGVLPSYLWRVSTYNLSESFLCPFNTLGAPQNLGQVVASGLHSLCVCMLALSLLRDDTKIRH